MFWNSYRICNLFNSWHHSTVKYPINLEFGSRSNRNIWFKLSCGRRSRIEEELCVCEDGCEIWWCWRIFASALKTSWNNFHWRNNERLSGDLRNILIHVECLKAHIFTVSVCLTVMSCLLCMNLYIHPHPLSRRHHHYLIDFSCCCCPNWWDSSIYRRLLACTKRFVR